MARTDHLPLSTDPSTKLMPWLVGFLVFIAVLATSGSMLLTGLADMWDKGLSGSVTIQIPPLEGDSEVETTAKTENILEAVQKTQGLGEVRLLPNTEIIELLSPWLGENINPENLPLPKLIEAEIDNLEAVDFEELNRRLRAISPGAIVDSHDVWRDHMIGLLNILRLVGLSVVALVTLSGVIMVVFATRGGLVAHNEVIEVLHLIGARDSFIARQFQSHVFWAALKGAVIGAILSFGVIWGLAEMANNLTGDSNLSTLPGLDTTQLVILGFIAPIASFIAMYAARRTVLTTLQKIM
ncbi:cell division protein FtsX [Curvivirga aplysinae]|uniref:cell division protein FtsX n=1 Tax=Curvivirga aplysinae TaxID=2529852 RepID=UPI0012BBC2A8|nr:FtsX-like permease family protein [Curvivirga aplysinae]MTI08819.1 FtsX-like permease family protein [Curvivirga aplysinae]